MILLLKLEKLYHKQIFEIHVASKLNLKPN